jgi:hypothetical protein
MTTYYFYPTESCKTQPVPENTKIWVVEEIIKNYTPAWETNDAGGESLVYCGSTMIYASLKVYRNSDEMFIRDTNGKNYDNSVYDMLKDQFHKPIDIEYWFYHNNELKQAYPNKQNR